MKVIVIVIILAIVDSFEHRKFRSSYKKGRLILKQKHRKYGDKDKYKVELTTKTNVQLSTKVAEKEKTSNKQKLGLQMQTADKSKM